MKREHVLEAVALKVRGSPCDGDARDAASQVRAVAATAGGRKGNSAYSRRRRASASVAKSWSPAVEIVGPRAGTSDVLQGEAQHHEYKTETSCCEATAESRTTTGPFPRALATRRVLAAACAGHNQRFGRISTWTARQ